MLARQMPSQPEAPSPRSPAGLRARVVAALKRPVRRGMEGVAWRVGTQLGPRLDEMSARLRALEERGSPAQTAAPSTAFFTTFHDLLHAQRSVELSRMPRGARVLLSAGCSGRWYFDWIEAEYGPVARHVGVERYLPKPDDLPDNVEWLAASISDVAEMGDGSVDLLFSGQNLEHLFGDECTDFLVEAARLVRPGGHLVMDSPNREIAGLLCWSMNQHTVEFTPDEAAELATLAGFEVTSLRGVWLSRDPDTGRPLPLDPFEEAVPPTEVVRRIQLGPRYPEHSFVWWLEARRQRRAPDVVALRRRHAEIFAAAWPERTNRLRHQVGSRREGREGARVAAEVGTSGYMVFGPFMPLSAAEHSVTYTLRRLPGRIEPDAVVAVLDVVAEGDEPTIARREVRAADLPEGGWTRIRVDFRPEELRWTGQFRVWSAGVVALEARLAVELDDPESPVRPAALRAAADPMPYTPAAGGPATG
jgi:hypothetical protein